MNNSSIEIKLQKKQMEFQQQIISKPPVGKLATTLLTPTNKPIRVQRKRNRGYRMPPNTKYVGRPTIYGNDLKVGDFVGQFGYATPEYAYDHYYETLKEFKQDCIDRNDIEMWEAFIAPLRNKNLACFCPLDQKCHADVLLEFAAMPKLLKMPIQ